MTFHLAEELNIHLFDINNHYIATTVLNKYITYY